jgi:hypothetical protein
MSAAPVNQSQEMGGAKGLEHLRTAALSIVIGLVNGYSPAAEDIFSQGQQRDSEHETPRVE